jgi:hypothetical protein
MLIGPADWLVAAQWLAAVGLMMVLAWEPWRQVRVTALAMSADAGPTRFASPGYVFVLPLLVLAAPFVPGSGGLWREPHRLLPGLALVLVAIVAVQALLCRRVLIGARRRQEALAPPQPAVGPL